MFLRREEKASIPFIDPATMTIIIVIKFTVVNILFRIEDSFTPAHSSIINSIIIPKAKKSGYSDRNEMFMGMKERKASLMTFPVSASM